MSQKYILAMDQGTTRRIYTVFSAARLGGTRCRGNLEYTDWHGCRSFGPTRVASERRGGHRYYKPKSDYGSMGCGDRASHTSCDCLAMPTYRGYLQSTEQDGWSEKVRTKTGLVIDAYFSGPKVQWILDNVPGARKQAEEGKLRFRTIDSWLIWKLTRGKIHVTDCSNASRTLLFNIHELRWDEELLVVMRIPCSMLPTVRPSSEVYGVTDPQSFQGGKIPIAGAAVQWLRDGLKLIETSADSEYFARKVEDAQGSIDGPCFCGTGVPYWDMKAHGAIFGLTRGTRKEDLIRATPDFMAYQTKGVIMAMELDAGLSLQSLKVEGGAVANDLLMQFQADMPGVPVDQRLRKQRHWGLPTWQDWQ